MANENDELQQNSDSDNHSSSNNNNQQTKSTTTTTTDVATVLDETQTAASSTSDSNNRNQHNNCEESEEGERYDLKTLKLTGAKGKLNDLVADLYMSTTLLNGPATSSSTTAEALMANPGYGDYTNIRATCGPTTGFSEGKNNCW